MSLSSIPEIVSVRMPKLEDIIFTFEALPEYEDVKGNILCSGDPEEDEKAEQEVLEAIRCGNPLAWFCGCVTGKYRGLKAKAYLGCCSLYESESQFMEEHGQNMKEEVLEDIKKQISALVITHGTQI